MNRERMIVLRKMDEMEMKITLTSVKWAWFYTVVFLSIWTVYDYIVIDLIGLPFILLISQNLIYLGTQTFLKWKMSKNEE